MRNMGGLRKHIPRTYWMMIIGTVALTGLGIPGTVIGTAGFFSKDAIIESLYVGQNAFAGYAFWMTVVAAFFTSFYSWRLIFMTFHGKPRASADVMSHVHESPNVMLVPLYILAVGALFAGVLFYANFIGAHHEPGALDSHYTEFWKGALYLGADNKILEQFHNVPKLVKWSPFIMMAAGFILAYIFYIRSTGLPAELARQHPGLYQFLLNKWYFDELYDRIFVRPAMWLGRFFWKEGDGRVIDGFGPNGISARILDVTRGVVKLQSGYLYHYAFAMLIGIAALVTYTMFAGAH
jgi:NADH-quinone oxidoreductase subunit L